MKNIAVLLLCVASIVTYAKGNIMISDTLVNALAMVESNNNSTKVGKLGELGILQIRQCILDDVNRIYKTNYVLNDAKNNTKAKEICKKYLQYWGEHYEKKTGKKATNEVLAKIWNGGPNANSKNNEIVIANLKRYWEKVQLQMV